MQQAGHHSLAYCVACCLPACRAVAPRLTRYFFWLGNLGAALQPAARASGRQSCAIPCRTASLGLGWSLTKLLICTDAAEAVACNEYGLESGSEMLVAAVNLRAAAELSLGRPNAARAAMADLPQHADAGGLDKERAWLHVRRAFRAVARKVVAFDMA